MIVCDRELFKYMISFSKGSGNEGDNRTGKTSLIRFAILNTVSRRIGNGAVASVG